VKSFIILLYISAFAILSPIKGNSNFYARKGLIDLRSWDIDKNGMTELKGEWEFYFGRYLNPGDFDNEETQKLKTHILVPGSWKGVKVNDKPTPLHGYATYRLKILMPKTSQTIVLHSDVQTPSSRYYINGYLVGYNGVPGYDYNSTTAEMNLHFEKFMASKDTMELVVHIANYQIENSGIIYPLYIGTEKATKQKSNYYLYVYVFLLGIFFVAAIYHLNIFMHRRKEWTHFYFSLACVALIGYFLHVSRIFDMVFPQINYEYSFKYLRFFLVAIVPCFAVYIFTLFPYESNKYFRKSIFYIGFGLLAIILFTPSYVHSSLAPYLRLYMLGSILYGVYCVIKGYINKKEFSGIFLIGFIVFALATVNDIFLYMGAINSIDMSPYGLLFFILIQTFILSGSISKAFNNAEQMADSLAFMNENLNNLVDARTTEINIQKEQISNQRDLIEAKTYHITQSIVYASRIQYSMLQFNQIFKQNLKEHFIVFKPKDIVSGDFYWAKEINGNLLVVTGDCTGHGVPGAFMTILCITFLNEIVQESTIMEPNKILMALRTRLVSTLNQTGDSFEEPKDGVEATIYTIDFSNKKLIYAGSRMPIYIAGKEDDLITLKPQYRNCFDLKHASFDNSEYNLQENDTIYTFTDGFIDQFRKTGKQRFGTKRFISAINNIRSKTLQDQKMSLQDELKDWQGDYEQIDDILVISSRV